MIPINLTEEEFAYLHIALVRAIITTEERIKHIEKRTMDDRFGQFKRWDDEDKRTYQKELSAFRAAQAAIFKDRKVEVFT
ncbi:MAG: hypothetical protein IKU94_00885 [Bacteroidaceae bacterium]|nr:hypothetical protein [Bacteroidaceae bacterium]MBR4930409.1 hypothetical protein [Bacteroidaceae bacterium]